MTKMFDRDSLQSARCTYQLCSEKLTLKGTGYRDLYTHAITKHSNEVIDLSKNDFLSYSASTSIKRLLWPKKTSRINPWIELVVLCHEPASFVERTGFQKHVNQESISTKTLMEYPYLHSHHVE